MKRLILPLTFVSVLSLSSFGQSGGDDDADQAIQIAESTISRMGGMEAWNDVRYLAWKNFGEMHYWDKWTGDFRWEEDSLVAVMNINSKEGRYWVDGIEVTDPADLEERLAGVYREWVNNSYWVVMPYKLLDPGVNLAYVGEEMSESGQISDVLEVTFDGVGLTPDNKYLVYVDRESGLVCQWTHFRNRGDLEPNFVRPWENWVDFGGVMLASGRGGRGGDIAYIALPAELPDAIFARLVY